MSFLALVLLLLGGVLLLSAVEDKPLLEEVQGWITST